MTTDTFQLPVRTAYSVVGRLGSLAARMDSLDEAIAYAAKALAAGEPVSIEPRTVPMTLAYDARDDDRTDRERIAAAFRTLRPTHVTSMGRICCGSCIGAEMGPKAKAAHKGVVAFNAQAWSSFDSDREFLTSSLHLQHGEPSDSDDTYERTPAILAAMRSQGLPAEWSGRGIDTVEVHPTRQPFCPGEGPRHSGYSCAGCRAVRAAKDRALRRRAMAAYRELVAGAKVTLADLRAIRATYGSDWRQRVRESAA